MWNDFKAFSKSLVEAIERDEPDRYTTNPVKARRRGKIFLDPEADWQGNPGSFLLPVRQKNAAQPV